MRPGVFDTREWTGDVRVGGRWKTSGLFRGNPYTLEGEFLEVDPPSKLVLTWESARSAKPSTLTYLLEPIDGGTRLTLRHSGLAKEQCADMQAGWESSFDALLAILPPI